MKLEIEFEAIKELSVKQLEQLIQELSQYYDEAYSEFIKKLRGKEK